MDGTSARAEIADLFHSGKHVGKTLLGDSMVVSGNRPDIRLVVKDNNVVVTVLPLDDQSPPQDDYQQEVEDSIKQCENRIAAIQAQRLEIAQERKEILARIEREQNELSKEENALKSRIASLKSNYYQSLLPVHRNRN